MDRKQKIEYLKQLAAGRLAPGDLLRLLPRRTEIWLQGDDGLFDGPARDRLTDREIEELPPSQGLRVHRVLIENPNYQPICQSN